MTIQSKHIIESIEYGGRVSAVRVLVDGSQYDIIHHDSSGLFNVFDIVPSRDSINSESLRRSDVETERRVLQVLTLGDLRDAFKRRVGWDEQQAALFGDDDPGEWGTYFGGAR